MIKDTIADQLVFATVRLECYDDEEKSYGTAFIVSNQNDDGTQIFLFTNKHVVTKDKKRTKFYDKARIILTNADDTGKPLNNQHTTIEIDRLSIRCCFHPNQDVDLCLLNIMDIINEQITTGKFLYFRSIGTDMFINEYKYFQDLTPIEDIIMIGYPIALIDEYNNKPVVRNGITATDVRLNYNNREEFLIDAACFHGSSGSPVFLRKLGLEKEGGDEGLTIGIMPQYWFLGVLYAGPTEKIDGTIEIVDMPTNLKPIVHIESMTNLGYVVKADRVLELISIFNEGLVV